MSPRLQVKLLRVLQENEFEPVGGTQTIRADVRVVAATNTNLKEVLRQGRFRRDLYYRLNVVPIHLPPLRERREDIPMLVDHFLEKYNRENGKTVTKISREVLDHLLVYSWPGNVRELENCIERAVVMSPGKTLLITLLPAEILNGTSGGPARWDQASPDGLRSDLQMLLDRYYKTAEESAGAGEELHRLIERIIISRALAEGMSQRTLAAKLGLSRTTLHKRLQEYGLDSYFSATNGVLACDASPVLWPNKWANVQIVGQFYPSFLRIAKGSTALSAS